MFGREWLSTEGARLRALLARRLPGVNRGAAILRAWQGIKAATHVAVGTVVARPDMMTAVLGAAFVLTTLGVFVFDLHVRYRDAIAGAKASALSYAEILSAHTALTFDSIDRVVLE